MDYAPAKILPGSLGWTLERDNWFLPKGLRSRSPVRVVRQVDPRIIEIEAVDGKRWSLYWWQLEFPMTVRFLGDSRVYTEMHHKVREKIRQNLQKQKELLLEDPTNEAKREIIAAMEWQLARSAKMHPFSVVFNKDSSSTPK